MKILHVIPSLDPTTGGPAEGLRQHAAARIHHGIKTSTITLDAPNEEFLCGHRFPVFAAGPTHGKIRFRPGIVERFVHLAASHDILVANGIWQYQTPLTRALAQRTGKPYVVFSHGMLDPWFDRNHLLKRLKKRAYWSLVEKRNLFESDGIFFTTEAERRLASENWGPFPTPALIAPYGTRPPPQCTEAEVRRTLEAFPCFKNQRVLLYLGRIHEKKGIDLLIKSYAKEAAKRSDTHLAIAGPLIGDFAKQMQRLAQDLLPAGSYTWMGELRGSAKWTALDLADAFILPSHQENFGIAVAEALACGKPVLITREVNIWETIERWRCGFTAEDTQDGVDSLIDDWLEMTPEATTRMSDRSRACFDQEFNLDRCAMKLVEMFESICRHRSRRSTLRSNPRNPA